MRLTQRFKAAYKAFNFLTSDGEVSVGSSGWRLPVTHANADVNSIVMACVLWACRNFSEAPPQVRRPLPGGGFDAIADHLMTELLRRPQARAKEPSKLTGRRMWKGVLYSRMMDGNAYLEKVRTGGGGVGALEFLPHTSCDPIPENGRPNVLSHYRVQTGWTSRNVAPEDIIHLADGIDPRNPLKGLSPLKSVMRQVMTDNEAAIYSHAILRMPVPGFLVSLKDKDQSFTQKQADELATMFRSQFTGENRGQVAVPNVPIEAKTLGLSPEQLALDKMLKVPEERITAVFGIPAIVAGMGAGLDRSTYANFKEAREAAVESFLVPTWAEIADDLDDQLLPDFAPQIGDYTAFDLAQVRVLQDDEDAKFSRWTAAYQGGVAMRSDARAHLGLEVGPGDDVYSTDLSFGSAPADVAKAKLMADLKAESRVRRALYDADQG